MKKLLITSLFSIFTLVLINAQDGKAASQEEAKGSAAQEEEIELPEVTTVISGDALTAGKDAIPDYAPVLPKVTDGTIELPTLGKVESAGSASPILAATSQEKSVYAQGRVGAGYPFMFLGDFGIYRATGNAPFAIDFSHKSIEGFGSEKASEGFFLRGTAVSASKSFNTSSSKNTFLASYDTSDYGLQSLSSDLFDVVNHTIAVSEKSTFSLNHGLFIGFGLEGDWYNRYGGKVTGSTLEGIESGSAVVSVSPSFNFGWKTDSFRIAFDADYQTQLNGGDSDNFIEIEGSSSQQASHRGEFALSSQWTSTYVALSGRAGIVAGTALGSPSIIAPFSGKIDLFIPYDEKGGVVTLTMEGGLQSEQSSIWELEKKYRYAIAYAIPTETTDWYGKGLITIPFDSILTISGGVEVFKTAFDNGVWEADYSGNRSAAGLYGIALRDRMEINPSAQVSFNYEELTFAFGYKSYLKDLPSACDKQNLTASVQYQSKDGKVSAGASLRQAFGEDADLTPDLGANGSYRLTSAIALALEANGIVKLFSNETRKYAHSVYKDESGNIAFLVKFQF